MHPISEDEDQSESCSSSIQDEDRSEHYVLPSSSQDEYWPGLHIPLSSLLKEDFSESDGFSSSSDEDEFETARSSQWWLDGGNHLEFRSSQSSMDRNDYYRRVRRSDEHVIPLSENEDVALLSENEDVISLSSLDDSESCSSYETTSGPGNVADRSAVPNTLEISSSHSSNTSVNPNKRKATLDHAKSGVKKQKVSAVCPARAIDVFETSSDEDDEDDL